MTVPAILSTPRSGSIDPFGHTQAHGSSALRRLQTQDPAAVRLPAAPVSKPSFGAPSSVPAREPGLQQRVGDLQQALAYGADLGQALQQLKSGLSQALARPQSPPSQQLAGRLEAVQQRWGARASESGGRLDPRLQVVAEGETSRQRFKLRGLDMNSLAAAGVETLRLAVPGQQRSIAVALDGRGLQRGLQSLQAALAPTALRVETAGGELQLSAPETDWPALRDGLNIRGDGKRFPSGQMVRALLEPQTAAMTPADWRVDDAPAQRSSLVQVLDAQAQLGRAQQQLQQGLAAASVLPATAAGSAAVHSAFAVRFADTASADALNYERLAQLLPAVRGLHRQQVQALLLSPAAAGAF